MATPGFDPDVDYYRVLGVPASADSALLKRAWRHRVRETHPDHGGDPRQFLLVQEAYEVLSDRSLRSRWEQAHGPTSTTQSSTGTDEDLDDLDDDDLDDDDLDDDDLDDDDLDDDDEDWDVGDATARHASRHHDWRPAQWCRTCAQVHLISSAQCWDHASAAERAASLRASGAGCCAVTDDGEPCRGERFGSHPLCFRHITVGLLREDAARIRREAERIRQETERIRREYAETARQRRAANRATGSNGQRAYQCRTCPEHRLVGSELCWDHASAAERSSAAAQARPLCAAVSKRNVRCGAWPSSGQPLCRAHITLAMHQNRGPSHHTTMASTAAAGRPQPSAPAPAQPMQTSSPKPRRPLWFRIALWCVIAVLVFSYRRQIVDAIVTALGLLLLLGMAMLFLPGVSHRRQSRHRRRHRRRRR